MSIEQEDRMNFFEKFQYIDQRLMYLLLIVVITVPLIWRVSLPIVVSPAVQGAYDAVEAIPDDKLAIISVFWGPGTIAENQPQMEAIVRHMFELEKRFAIIAFDPQGSKLAYDLAHHIGREMEKEYGTDWLHWGFHPPANLLPLVQSFPRDVQGVIGTDYHGTPLSQIPAMEGINVIGNIGLIAEITPSATLEIWIGYIYGSYGTPIIYAPTAVMAPEGFNPLDAGQIKGMLIGMKGAAEYERLLEREDFATRGTDALSASHLLIIGLIIIGNIGYITARRRRSREG